MPKARYPLLVKACANPSCGKEFKQKSFTQQFCSKSCAVPIWNARRYEKKEPFERKCGKCGAIFSTTMERNKYCSKACYQRAQRDQARVLHCKENSMGHFAMKICAREECAGEFRSWSLNKIYCTARCQQLDARKRHLGEDAAFGLPSGVVGAIGELRVCADLLLKGYEVFRAVAATCSCDLVALSKNKALAKIEVKTGFISKVTGTVIHTSQVCHKNADVVAIACRTGEVVYRSRKEDIKCQTDWTSLWTSRSTSLEAKRAPRLSRVISSKN